MINFVYNEIIKSNTAKKYGIDNRVPEVLFDNMLNSVVGIQKIRDLLQVPMIINSWYRCPALNSRVGGSSKSAHMKCLAVDFVPIRMDIKDAYEMISKSNLQFDQLILERNSRGSVWIHVSFDNRNRRQVFTLKKED